MSERDVIAAVEYELRPKAPPGQRAATTKIISKGDQRWVISTVIAFDKLKPSVKFGVDGLTVDRIVEEVKSFLKVNKVPLSVDLRTEERWVIDWVVSAQKPFIDKTIEDLRLRFRPFNGIRVIASEVAGDDIF